MPSLAAPTSAAAPCTPLSRRVLSNTLGMPSSDRRDTPPARTLEVCEGGPRELSGAVPTGEGPSSRPNESVLVARPATSDSDAGSGRASTGEASMLMLPLSVSASCVVLRCWRVVANMLEAEDARAAVMGPSSMTKLGGGTAGLTTAAGAAGAAPARVLGTDAVADVAAEVTANGCIGPGGGGNARPGGLRGAAVTSTPSPRAPVPAAAGEACIRRADVLCTPPRPSANASASLKLTDKSKSTSTSTSDDVLSVR